MSVKKIALGEEFLYDIWENQKFFKELKTKNGQPIEIVETGSRNADLSGPDFKDARIKIGNITYKGDVELDKQYGDWKLHGHYFNKKYNKVILHVFFSYNGKYPYVFTEDGRKVQSIPLLRFVSSSLKRAVQKSINHKNAEKYTNMPCIDSNFIVSKELKLDYLRELGVIRFRDKGQKYLNRLKEIIHLKEMKLKEPVVNYEPDENFYNRNFSSEDFSDKKLWQQLIYESIFEALGYSRNKDIMRKLARTVDFDFIYSFKDEDNYIEKLEAIFFSVSGMIPDVPNLPDEETSEYSRELYQCWSQIKDKYDGEMLNPVEWNFYKLRPQNFPTIRIAGGVRLLDKLINKELIEKIINALDKKVKDIYILRKIRDMLMIKGDGFWKSHYVFDQEVNSDIKFFVGSTRGDDIIINVILPILLVYFEVFDKDEYVEKIIRLYSDYSQTSENFIVKEVSSVLNLNNAWKISVVHQGMIYLYRNYCSKKKCAECRIGEKLFL